MLTKALPLILAAALFAQSSVADETCNPKLGQTKYTILNLGPEYVGEEHAKATATHFYLGGLAVHYMTDAERERYRVYFKDGLITKANGTPFCAGDPCEVDYVMSPNGELYVRRHDEFTEFIHEHFCHSTFLAGKPVSAAGEALILNGKFVTITNYSGHYKPTWETNVQLIMELRAQGAGDPTMIGFTTIGRAHPARAITIRKPFSEVSAQVEEWIKLLEPTPPPKPDVN